MKRVAIDVGGTFTDCLILDESGAIHEYKTPTTPANPSVGFIRSLEDAARMAGQSLSSFLGDVEILIHGTTLAINTLLTGRGATTGMVTTANFRDVIEIRRGIRDQRVSLFNVFIPPYKPLIPRRLRIGVKERVKYTGDVLEPLDEEAVRAAALELKAKGAESVAVCFLYSYANPAHERMAAAICTEIFGKGRVTASHDILRVWREFERFSTTAVSAYVGPVVDDYLDSLEQRLRQSGFSGSLLIMLANGLVQTVDQCRGRAVYLLGSGPAAAPAAALNLAESEVGGELISVDMGGTSFDVCAIRRSEIPSTTESWVGDHRVAIKMVDVHSIGAGGGSIGWVDSLGLLRVGPQSAGADPGPACYGKGNSEPTVTDADLVLGYIPSDYFLGGSIPLSERSARDAISRLGDRLGMEIEQAANAIFETVNAQMADLVTEVCTRRGLDVRDFAMVAGGGAGPVHAAFLAEKLDMNVVFVPSVAALYSAFGMLSMNLGRDFTRSHVARALDVEPELVAGLFEEMEEEAVKDFTPLGIQRKDLILTRTAEMRYVGQFHEVEVPVPDGPITRESLIEVVNSLHQRHQELYSFAMTWMPAQFLTFRLVAAAKQVALDLKRADERDRDPAGALKRRRRCLWEGIASETAVYAGDRLQAGNVIEGPAIVEARTTTIVVPQGFRCRMDALKNYVLTREGLDARNSLHARVATPAVAGRGGRNDD